MHASVQAPGSEWQVMPTKQERQRRKNQRRKTKHKRRVFQHFEAVDGEETNVVEGLVLHNNVITPEYETELVEWLEQQMALGQAGKLVGDTFMQSSYTDRVNNVKGKGRLVLQYGSFYNYASHQISPDTPVDFMPPVLNALIDALIKNKHLPKSLQFPRELSKTHPKGFPKKIRDLRELSP